MRMIDAGIFIPVGNRGWVVSSNAPEEEDASYPRVLTVVKKAEALGFDFALSPAIWRGYQGSSEYWMRSLESLTLSAALLQATSRIMVYGTVHMTVYPPATIAKMIGTLDQIGPGRVGLNLVTGANYLDLSHLGLWRDGLDHDERYDLADEWITVAKRLWSEGVVSHKGRHFALDEAVMGPKPSRLPPLANAGASGRGMKFAVDNCDIAFIATGEGQEYIAAAKSARTTAGAAGKSDLKIYGLFTLIPGDTDDDARARLAHFDAGVDQEAQAHIAQGYAMNPNAKDVSTISKGRGGHGTGSSVARWTMIGSYESLAGRIAKVVDEGDLDGIILVVPDYVTDLEAIAGRTLSRLVEYGITCRVGQA
ncbi:LLM class flavin-dependent oxidoreductase [Mesorhizobium sp. CAU 1732]|uniref:LLM class flavin-dependent oxidoreductase n=1 Tax=Mesorhizobium sp. CAU 1732 TaxID=3140358 RepID=UPI003260877D